MNLNLDEKSSDDENGLNTVKEDEMSNAEEGTLLKVCTTVVFVTISRIAIV